MISLRFYPALEMEVPPFSPQLTSSFNAFTEKFAVEEKRQSEPAASTGDLHP